MGSVLDLISGIIIFMIGVLLFPNGINKISREKWRNSYMIENIDYLSKELNEINKRSREKWRNKAFNKRNDVPKHIANEKVTNIKNKEE